MFEAILAVFISAASHHLLHALERTLNRHGSHVLLTHAHMVQVETTISEKVGQSLPETPNSRNSQKHKTILWAVYGFTQSPSLVIFIVAATDLNITKQPTKSCSRSSGVMGGGVGSRTGNLTGDCGLASRRLE